MRPARRDTVESPDRIQSGPPAGRIQVVEVLPNLGKLQPTKSAGDACCRSPLAAAM